MKRRPMRRRRNPSWKTAPAWMKLATALFVGGVLGKLAGSTATVERFWHSIFPLDPNATPPLPPGDA